MNEAVDVAIVGAGPYGLSVAAHLRAAGVSMREFGKPMNPWRTAMPEGMYLKSQGFASNLSDPDGTHTLAAFCRQTNQPYADTGLPVPLDTFIAYGRWFAAERAGGLEEALVTQLVPDGEFFDLTLDSGETARARRVVVATGIEHFAYIPPELAGLPSTACTHSSAHTDLSVFAGRKVVVVGAGQSALETAALLHEHGAEVQIVMRKAQVVWNGPPLPLDRPLYKRMREPEVGLGSGWSTWFYSRHPKLYRHLPEGTRVYRARTALGPAGACWLRERVEGKIPILSGYSVGSVKEASDGVVLGLEGAGGPRQVTADHVIAATGYRSDLGRLAFLGEALRSRLRTVAGTPVVAGDYESSVPGLYFAGPGVAPTFGPVMRFVYGSEHAAKAIAPRLVATARSRNTASVGAGR